MVNSHSRPCLSAFRWPTSTAGLSSPRNPRHETAIMNSFLGNDHTAATGKLPRELWSYWVLDQCAHRQTGKHSPIGEWLDSGLQSIFVKSQFDQTLQRWRTKQFGNPLIAQLAIGELRS